MMDLLPVSCQVTGCGGGWCGDGWNAVGVTDCKRENGSVATVLLHQSGKSIAAAAAAAEIFLSAAESKSTRRVDLYSPRFKIYKETHPRFIHGVLCWEPLFCPYY